MLLNKLKIALALLLTLGTVTLTCAVLAGGQADGKQSAAEPLPALGAPQPAVNAQEDKDEVSRAIVERFGALPEYAAAGTVMWYLDVRSEVRTRYRIGEALNAEKRIVVPYCTVDEHGANKLGLWHLASMDELIVGKWSILEPPRERWGDPGKEVAPGDLDLVMVPGVGFARDGARLGNGQGYYDRLLH